MNYTENNRKGVTANRNKKTAVIRAYKGERGCSVCGEKDPIVLEFHHRKKNTKHKLMKTSNQNKSFQSLGWGDLFKEIEKCDVLCANCHRRTTYSERIRG